MPCNADEASTLAIVAYPRKEQNGEQERHLVMGHGRCARSRGYFRRFRRGSGVHPGRERAIPTQFIVGCGNGAPANYLHNDCRSDCVSTEAGIAIPGHHRRREKVDWSKLYSHCVWFESLFRHLSDASGIIRWIVRRVGLEEFITVAGELTLNTVRVRRGGTNG